ncbi:hypothetical protein BDQ94DRAFT_156923 [Aspergillus welwitschiae]|uniref:Secreted protein n=1 Tax=Aspergillus welwitschiae TaxID=1341132 RepID=A0A3F3QG60_9EURO|nr:hypothetical protein BDQ94DRAFT_156923 [Aspergillus welwitschiae]RDH38284.1 hypothetical protein BDQ94DRAFT_156923 [Aspergillus welwitschiae]
MVGSQPLSTLLCAAIVLGRAASPTLLGTFENPGVICRPRFRYWLPDSGVDPDIVATDIKNSGEHGAGGIEFVPFFNYGGESGGPPPEANWVANGFGTPAFRDVFRAALQAHKDAGLFMDFAMGPNQGQGVPAAIDDPGLQWDLVPYSREVATNGTFHDKLPGWGVGELVAVVSARVISHTNVSLPEVDSPYLTAQSSYLSLVLDHTTLSEITDQVSEEGQLSLSFPTGADCRYRIFAYYQRQPLNKNLRFTNNNMETIWDNGSYVVDHYSARGAQTVIQFWEKNILIDGIKELLMEVGNYDAGAGYINDYRGVLEDCYREYLQTFSDWLHNELHLNYSAQVSYNLPMDMEASIPVVDTPECESLQFGDSVDAYRQFSGPAVLAGKRVISNEMGATTGAYDYPFPRLLFSVGLAVIGGVNQIVLHGQSYTGDYYETTWPGYTAFSYTTSELYSDKQPSWDHGLSDVLGFLSRVQHTQRHGSSRIDVAIYNKVSATDSVNFPPIYQANDLIKAGWSWTYISPDNFALPGATVKDHILGPDGPRFKALVVTKNSNMTLAGVRKMHEYATRGLPILFSGGFPGIYVSGDENGAATIRAKLTELSASANVHIVGEGGVADKLTALGLSPYIGIQTNGKWLTTYREDSSTGIDYGLIFCDSNTSSGYITVTGPAKKKIPYYLNAWTGDKAPIFTYNVTESGLTIPVSLKGNQTLIVAFYPPGILSESDAPQIHAVETPASVIGATSDRRGGWVAHVARKNGSENQPERIQLSSGNYFDLLHRQQIANSFNLSKWHLIAEHWEAPTDLYEARITARKYNTTHDLPSLMSWSKIPSLMNSSGLGYYSTAFEWPPADYTSFDHDPPDGAYIIFPSILHAIQVTINGHRVPPLDYTDARADITAYLKTGRNEVLAVVPTTMWNYIRSILPNIRDQGRLPGLLTEGLPIPEVSENGLIAEAIVIPYSKLSITDA